MTQFKDKKKFLSFKATNNLNRFHPSTRPIQTPAHQSHRVPVGKTHTRLGPVGTAV